MGINRIATKMQTGGMSTKEIIKQLHGNLGNIKEAAPILIADAKAAKLNETIANHQQNVVTIVERTQGSNREAVTALMQDRRTADAASNLNASSDQITSAMQAAADKRKKITEELKQLIASIHSGQTDITAMLTNSNASTTEIKIALSQKMITINQAFKKLDPELPTVFDNDKAILANSRKLGAQIRETAMAYSIQLPEMETPRQTK